MNRASFNKVLAASREVQDYLWGEAEARQYSNETWINVLEKRIRKLREIDQANPHAAVEQRKRVLQVVAVGLAWLEAMES